MDWRPRTAASAADHVRQLQPAMSPLANQRSPAKPRRPATAMPRRPATPAGSAMPPLGRGHRPGPRSVPRSAFQPRSPPPPLQPRRRQRRWRTKSTPACTSSCTCAPQCSSTSMTWTTHCSHQSRLHLGFRVRPCRPMRPRRSTCFASSSVLRNSSACHASAQRHSAHAASAGQRVVPRGGRGRIAGVEVRPHGRSLAQGYCSGYSAPH